MHNGCCCCDGALDGVCDWNQQDQGDKIFMMLFRCLWHCNWNNTNLLCHFLSFLTIIFPLFFLKFFSFLSLFVFSTFFYNNIICPLFSPFSLSLFLFSTFFYSLVLSFFFLSSSFSLPFLIFFFFMFFCYYYSTITFFFKTARLAIHKEEVEIWLESY